MKEFIKVNIKKEHQDLDILYRTFREENAACQRELIEMKHRMAKIENDLIESEKKSSAGLEKLFKERS